MADNKYGDYLKKYYRRLHAKAMVENTNVMARLLDEKEKGLLTAEQERWFIDFLEPDPTAPGKYRAKNLPDPLDEEELLQTELQDKIYRAMTLTLSDLKSHSVDYREPRDTNILRFIDRWMVGDKPYFKLPQATDECKNSITKLLNFLNTSDRRTEIKNWIVRNTTKIDDSNSKQFDNIRDLDKFIKENTATPPKYGTDTKARDKLKQISMALGQYLNQPTIAGGEDYRNQQALLNIDEALNVITQEDAFSKIDDTALKDFVKKGPNGIAPINEFLNTLYYDKSVREKYKKYDGLYKITERVEKAESRIPWQDSKSDDYIKPKLEDVRTPLQRLKKWTADTYRDTIDKYKELRSIPAFKSSQAKELFKQIDKLGIKPADGLNTLLDKSADVKKKLSDKTVEQHFDWFVETMNAIKADIPNAVDGAWRNAKQMKCVIEQIILKAADPNNNDPDAVDKAKTAMEIMTAMKYGMLTSKIMDTIKQTDFTIFSDKDLSWNKNNDAIKFVTSAFDKSVKAAFMGIGYAVTFIGNNYFLSGRTFSGKDNQSGLLSKAFNTEQNRVTEHASSNSREDIQNLINKKTQEKAQQLQQLGISDEKSIKNLVKNLETQKDTILGGNQFTQYKKDIETAETERNQIAERLKQHEEQMKKLENVKDEYEQYERIVDKKDELQLRKDIQDQKELIKSLEDAKAKETDADTQKALADQIAQQNVENLKKQQHLKDLEQQDSDPNSERYKKIQAAQTFCTEHKSQYDEYLRLEQEYETYSQEYETADQKYKTAQTQYDNATASNPEYVSVTDKIEKFNQAEKNITDINKTIKAMDKALTSWDRKNLNKVLILQEYWNDLQGKTNEQTNLSLNMYNQNGRN